MKKVILLIGLLLFLLLPVQLQAQNAPESDPIVQAVLFYSPTCPHCHRVINNDLPPLQEEYGERLQILGVDTSKPTGQELYQSAVAHFEIPQQRLGVPMLIVGEVVMVGSREIPEQFPGLIEAGMAAGGIGWPDIPQLSVAVPNLPPSADPDAVAAIAVNADVAEAPETAAATAPQPAPPPAAEPDPISAQTDATAADSPAVVDINEIDSAAIVAEEAVPSPDPVGFGLAWLIMIGMVVALAFVLMRFRMVQPNLPQALSGSLNGPMKSWTIPLLVLLGLAIAAYLAYVEVQQVTAVCGPIGECNIVQASPYARIFGIPVAVLGLINYAAVGALWLWQLADSKRQVVYYSLVALTITGTLFSIYLTALELFAIHAVCAWCLTSAVVTTLLMVIVIATLTQRPPANKVDLQMGTD